MIQEYIAYLIITLAFGIFVHKMLSFFNLIGKKSVSKGNCSGCTTGCEMKEIHFLKQGLTIDQGLTPWGINVRKIHKQS